MAAVLVHIDLDAGRPDPSSLVALAAGRHLASSWGATLYAAVIVEDTSEHTPDSSARLVAGHTVPGLDETEATLGRIGADKIIVALSDVPVEPLWAVIGNAWQAVLDHLRPRLVLFGADSPSATELAPRTGARLGARLLERARAIGIDDVELRDRDGGYARIADGGAVVAMIGRADRTSPADEDVDLIVLAAPGGIDTRVEIVGVTAAEPASTAVIALGDDVAKDSKVVASARKLAKLLHAQVIASDAAPVAPALCVTVGNARLELAGSTSVVAIGTRDELARIVELAGKVART